MKTQEEEVRQQELNTIAEIVISRIQDKLRGLEFSNNKNNMKEAEQAGPAIKIAQKKEVVEQVDILIK